MHVLQRHPDGNALTGLHFPERRILMPWYGRSAPCLVKVPCMPEQQVRPQQVSDEFSDLWHRTEGVGSKIVEVAIDCGVPWQTGPRKQVIEYFVIRQLLGQTAAGT